MHDVAARAERQGAVLGLDDVLDPGRRAGEPRLGRAIVHERDGRAKRGELGERVRGSAPPPTGRSTTARAPFVRPAARVLLLRVDEAGDGALVERVAQAILERARRASQSTPPSSHVVRFDTYVHVRTEAIRATSSSTSPAGRFELTHLPLDPVVAEAIVIAELDEHRLEEVGVHLEHQLRKSGMEQTSQRSRTRSPRALAFTSSRSASMARQTASSAADAWRKIPAGRRGQRLAEGGEGRKVEIVRPPLHASDGREAVRLDRVGDAVGEHQRRDGAEGAVVDPPAGAARDLAELRTRRARGRRVRRTARGGEATCSTPRFRPCRSRPVATGQSTSPAWNIATCALRVRGESAPSTIAAPPRRFRRRSASS